MDLGEARAHHWSIALKQVLKVPHQISEEHFIHDFPHKAYFTTLLETLTLYLLLDKENAQ